MDAGTAAVLAALITGVVFAGSNYLQGRQQLTRERYSAVFPVRRQAIETAWRYVQALVNEDHARASQIREEAISQSVWLPDPLQRVFLELYVEPDDVSLQADFMTVTVSYVQMLERGKEGRSQVLNRRVEESRRSAEERAKEEAGH